MVVLWNVSIRKSVGIRVPSFHEIPNENFCDLSVNNVIGFGVCPLTFDPTILRIKCIKRNDRCIKVCWSVQVFTLSTGTWSNLSSNLPRESIRLEKYKCQVVIDRFIYWIAYDMPNAEVGRSQSNFLIISFDLTAKEFKEINLPDNLANRRCIIQSISKLRESLVLLEYHTESEQDLLGRFCLWMMKEQGVSRSFTKLYTVNLPVSRIHQILGFRKTGELIIETRQDYHTGEVQIYKRNNEYADNLGINGQVYSIFMCSYTESLLLVDKSDGYIYPSIVHT